MTQIRNSILSGIAFGFLFGLFLAIKFNLNDALIAGPISGIVFGFAAYRFVSSKIVKRQTQIELNGKTIIRSGGANHFLNGEAVGGKLYLLDDRIVFKSHNFNLQNHGKEILLDNIASIEFYNTLGIMPTGLEILTKESQSEKFVLSNRKLWKTEINKIKTGYNSVYSK